jgi:Ca2+ transporting ATPase
MTRYYNQSATQTLKSLDSDIKKGLNQEQVSDRLQEYGPNQLPEKESTSLFLLVLEQFKDQLVLILLGAALISFVLAYYEQEGNYIEPIVILVILIANAVVGVVQETNAEKAIEALKEYSALNSTCLRDGSFRTIPARDLVPGDIVSLQIGSFPLI